MKLLIAGDYAPLYRVKELLDKNDFSFFNDIKNYTSCCDFSIVNLEIPIVEGDVSPIYKSGPALRTSQTVTESLRYAEFDCVTLANNHFRDYGEIGVKNTLQSLENSRICYMGGGNNLFESQKPFIFEHENIKIGFINVCEHEFSIADNNSGGSAPLEVVDVTKRIVGLKKEVDFVVVIVHGGHEHYQLPSPRMKKLYRFFIDMGADVIVNHHQHCYSGYETYKGNPIFYGLGNLCFDNEGKRDSIWNYGFFIILNIDKSICFDIIPYEQCNNEPVVKLLKDKEKNHFFDEVKRINNIIENDNLMQDAFDNFCNSRTHSVNSTFSPLRNRIMRGLAKYGLLPYFLPRKKKCDILSYVQCESHRDVVCNVLKKII